MIKTNINNYFPHQYLRYKLTNLNLHVADFTEMSKALVVKRGLEFFAPDPPSDNLCFSLFNPHGLNIGYIDYNNESFVDNNGNPKSQCECVILPDVSTNNTWIVFIELKYSTLIKNNHKNLTKAIQQLLDTHSYYTAESVISTSNPSYLFASIPPQSIPFGGFILSPGYITTLKRTRNIILRLRNDAIIENDQSITFE